MVLTPHVEHKKVLVLIAGLILLAGVGFIVFEETPVSTPVANIPSDWKEYSSSSLGFKIKYDSTVTMREDSAATLFYKWGPTQSEGTEIYDGFILGFNKVNLSGTLNEYIEQQMQSFRDVGSIDIPLHETSINGMMGLSFTGSGLGVFTLTFIPLNNNTAFVVSYMVADPGNLGFQGTVDLMLSTLELNQ